MDLILLPGYFAKEAAAAEAQLGVVDDLLVVLVGVDRDGERAYSLRFHVVLPDPPDLLLTGWIKSSAHSCDPSRRRYTADADL